MRPVLPDQPWNCASLPRRKHIIGSSGERIPLHGAQLPGSRSQAMYLNWTGKERRDESHSLTLANRSHTTLDCDPTHTSITTNIPPTGNIAWKCSRKICTPWRNSWKKKTTTWGNQSAPQYSRNSWRGGGCRNWWRSVPSSFENRQNGVPLIHTLPTHNLQPRSPQ